MLPLPLNRSLLTVVAACVVITGLAFAEKGPGDVTDKVNAAVKDESLSISALNEVFGDTAPGIPKKLTVEYQVGDEKLTSEAPEGDRIQISAPAGKKLIILKATYAPADGSAPINTEALTESPGEVLATLPGFKVDHVLQADAAKNGSWICMTNDPRGRLLLGGQSGQPITRVTLKDGKSVKAEILS
ncbi:MAG: hypothetical protein ACKV19_23755, partial [Verrucomicrobiales bacterium]